MFTIIGADGKEYGPVSAAKVNEWIAGGRANLQTQARRASDADWKTLGDFPEFQPAGSAPLPAAIPPFPSATAPAGTLLPAGRWQRLGAAILDSLIGFLFAIPGCVLLFMAGAIGPHSGAGNPAFMIAGFGALGLAVLVLLVIQIYLLTTRGQTIGKKLLGIRIVTFDDETNPGFVKAVLLRVIINGIIGSIPVAGPIYSLVDICFIFRDDRRCIHDLIAGTKVVDASGG
jgi:uncharacterized RDD family membrane protein YckC